MKDPWKRESDIFARGDAVAKDLLAWLYPLRFAEAADEGEREAAYRLRYRAVLDERMEDPARFPQGMEYDEYDSDAVQILGWDETGPIATCRLVLPAPDRCLPFEKVFGPVARATGPMVEWGRVVVDSHLRGQGGRIFMGLAARGWLSMRSRGLSAAIGVTPERLIRLFRALGFPLVVLGPPRVHWGEERVPILCEGPVAVQTLEHMWFDRDDGRTPNL
jgi:N-acyl-L-homoserine lactone synthetase